MPLDYPETHIGAGPFIKNIKAVVENISSMMDINRYTLAYCNLLAHDENWIEVPACLQIHEIILEDMLTPPIDSLPLIAAKKEFQQRKEMIQKLSQLEAIREEKISIPIFKEMPKERDLLRQALLVAVVKIYYASKEIQAWSLIEEFVSGYDSNEPERFADVIVQCRFSLFSANRNYAVKDILAIDAILKKNTGPISSKERSTLLQILKQDPRPLEWLWQNTRRSLCRLLRPQ